MSLVDAGLVVDHRLRASRRHVADREAPMSEAGMAVGPDAVAIEAAMRKRIRHACNVCTREGFAPKVHDTGNSAH